MQRRNFLNKAVSFSMLVAFHKEAEASARLMRSSKKSESRPCRFPEITLYTSKLEEQFDFYAKTLEFPVIDHDSTRFSIQIGESVLRFKTIEDGSEPFYHYAINIPSNKIEKAKDWLSARTPLLVNAGTGEDLLHFESWDAHAIYFKDPSGNIGEFIARHTLDNDREGEFDVTDLLCVSEIGIPVEDPYDLGAELKIAYGLDNYGGSAMFIGDEYGLFVAPPVGRLWFPESIQEARVHPTEIYISDKGDDQFGYRDYPYQVIRKE